MIRAVLFDLGNVLLFFSHERMYAQMGALLDLPPAEVHALLARDRFQWRYEAGEVSTDEVMARLAALSRRPFTRDAMLEACSDIFTPNAAMLPVLRGLKSRGYRLVIVSNTNEAHMEWARPRYELFRYFDALIFSYDVRAMKPDRRFYAAAQKAAGCAPAACLFTDDLAENVAGAQAFGFDGVVFTGAEAFTAALAERGIQL